MVAQIFAASLWANLIDPALLLIGEKMAGQIGFVHLQAKGGIVVRILPGGFVWK